MKMGSGFVARALLAAAGLAMLVASAAAQTQAEAAGMTVTLLGTAGGPIGHPERSGIATLVSVGSRRYLVDAGAGVVRQLARAGIPETQVPVVFLTHLHDDHTVGLPALMSFAWTQQAGRMELIGPPGTRRWFDAVIGLLSINAAIRRDENPRKPPLDAVFSAREIAAGMIYSDDAVKVSALQNTHYRARDGAPGDSRSYSLKFQAAGRTVVLTGDTGPSDALAEFAQGADLLVSEMVSRTDIAAVPPFVREHMVQEHLTTAEVGKLAAKAGVKTVVISHVREVSDADVAEVRQHFGGSVVVGTDLARF
jgi:ribonuclease BN (tRNA processing enzyme)